MKYRELLEACWNGYQQRGMKKKGDRMVPNCVKMTEQELEEDLKKWFREKWVRFGPDGKIRGECGGRDSSEGKPKCLPSSKAHSLGKKGRKTAAAKKRREDPNPERRGSAINVATKPKRKMDEYGAANGPPNLTKSDIKRMMPPEPVAEQIPTITDTGPREQPHPAAQALGALRVGTNLSKVDRYDVENAINQELMNIVRGGQDASSGNVSILNRLFGRDKNR
jgi:hypothetical protein